jgi:crotonobetainyl-CoA:carnitine CoA-transferase CaiB-like acyl-CoA transferase
MLRCADAWISLFAIRNWITLCQVFGHEEWQTDPRFDTQADRLANWPMIVDLMQQKATDMPADDLVARLQAGRVSAERVAGVEDLIAGAQWAARGVLTTVGGQTAMSHIFEISDARTSVPGPSPAVVTR